MPGGLNSLSNLSLRRINLQAILALFKQSLVCWNDIDAPRLGAALAYYTVLSLAPLLVIAVGIAGLVFGRKAAEGQIIWQFRDTIGDQGASTVQTLLQSIHRPTAGIVATTLGSLVLLFSSSGVFVELRDSMNDVWGVRGQSGGGFGSMVRERFYAFAMVLGIGILLVASLLTSAFLAAASEFFGSLLPVPAWLLQIANIPVSLVVFAVLFALIYKIVPDVAIAWRDVWLGAAVTSVLFTVGNLLIGLYLGKAGVGSAYGAAASLVVLLAWVYFSAQILLFGATFTRCFSEKHGSRAAIRRLRGQTKPVERPN
jgi:membrane protein